MKSEKTTVKVETPKTASAAKKSQKDKATVNVKVEAPKAAAPKTAAPKAAASKAAAPKATVTEKKAPAKKPAAKKAVMKETIYLQYAGKEVNTQEIMKNVKEYWTKTLKNKVGDMKEVTLYLKPEELMVYFVINGDVTGRIEL